MCAPGSHSGRYHRNYDISHRHESQLAKQLNLICRFYLGPRVPLIALRLCSSRFFENNCCSPLFAGKITHTTLTVRLPAGFDSSSQVGALTLVAGRVCVGLFTQILKLFNEPFCAKHIILNEACAKTGYFLRRSEELTTLGHFDTLKFIDIGLMHCKKFPFI